MPEKATAGSAPDFSAGSRSSRKLILSCDALGLGLGVLALAEQDPQHPRCDAGQHPAAGDRTRLRPVVPRHLGAVRAGGDRADPGTRDDLRAGLDGRLGQGRRDGPHAADRHPPLAGPVADQVVEEAAVLDQRRVVHRGERADQGVGGDDAAHGVVGEARLDGATQRLGDDVGPQALVDEGPDVALEGEGLHQRRGDGLREAADLVVERQPRGVLVIGPGEVAEGRPRRLALGALHEQAALAAVTDPGRVRRRGARGEPDVEAEVGHQLLGHQADEVGVAREADRLAGEGLDGDGGATGVVEALEHEDGEPGAREVGRADQAVVPATDHDDVIAAPSRFHPDNLVPG